MNAMYLERKFFLDSLMRYVTNPCPATIQDLTHRQMMYEHRLSVQEQESENRIVEKVLERLSLTLNEDGTLKEIQSLRDELQKLYEMFE